MDMGKFFSGHLARLFATVFGKLARLLGKTREFVEIGSYLRKNED